LIYYFANQEFIRGFFLELTLFTGCYVAVASYLGSAATVFYGSSATFATFGVPVLPLLALFKILFEEVSTYNGSTTVSELGYGGD